MMSLGKVHLGARTHNKRSNNLVYLELKEQAAVPTWPNIKQLLREEYNSWVALVNSVFSRLEIV